MYMYNILYMYFFYSNEFFCYFSEVLFNYDLHFLKASFYQAFGISASHLHSFRKWSIVALYHKCSS